MKSQHKLWKILLIGGAVIVATFAFRFGYQLTYFRDGRDPAAIQRNYDFSNLEGDSLSRAVHARLIEGMNLVTAGDSMGVELGSFMTKNADGQSVNVCEVYNKVEMRFHASGMSVSGEPPVLLVQGDCQPSDYLNRIAPLMIPFGAVLNKQVKDLKFNGENDPSLQISFVNVSDSWPHTWVLNSVKLYNLQGQELVIVQDEIKNILGKHLALELPQ